MGNYRRNIFFILCLYIIVSVVGCIDDKSVQADSDLSANNGFPSTASSGRPPRALPPERLERFTRDLVTHMKKQPCVNNKAAAQRVLREGLFQQVIREEGVPYTQLYTVLKDVVAPDAINCDQHSCNKLFALKMHEVPKFLEVSEKTAERLNAESPGVATLRSSFTLPTPGGEWQSPGFFGPKSFSAKGFTTVYTYQKEQVFPELVGQPVDLTKPEEARALAEALIMAKMERGPEGNKRIHSVRDAGGYAIKGYGLYAATDPYQTPEFGEILIAFDIPNSAYYTYSDSDSSLMKQIKSSVLGIIYEYLPSVSGVTSVVLRHNPTAQPLGQPVIPGSVRIYRNSTKLSLNFAGLDQLAETKRVSTGRPDRDFMERYGNYLGFFSPWCSEIIHDLSFSPDLNNILLYILKQDLYRRPQWVKDGLDRVQRILSSDPDMKRVRLLLGDSLLIRRYSHFYQKM